MSVPTNPVTRAAIGAVMFSTFSVVAFAQSEARPPLDDRPIRVGLRARGTDARELTPFSYLGGFETKTLMLETLVRRGADGHIEGALASGWQIEMDGSFVFELREGAEWYDGEPVTAEQVCAHFRRWIGHTEHDWLRANRYITGAEALSDSSLRITMKEPYALLEDLIAINPCALLSPESSDWEGVFKRPIGTGPFRFVRNVDAGAGYVVAPIAGDGPPLEVRMYARGRDNTPVHDVVLGNTDVFVGGWDEDLPAEMLTAVDQDPGYTLTTAPGSSVLYLSFRLEGPTANTATRARITAAIDREALVRVVEGGRADPCASWAAPSVGFWPAGPAARRLRDGDSAAAAAAFEDAEPVSITIAPGRANSRSARIALEVAHQLRRAGIDARATLGPPSIPESKSIVVDADSDVVPRTSEAGQFRRRQRRALRAATRSADLVVETTYGMPYCPHQSLVSRFTSRDPESTETKRGSTDELTRLVEQAAATPSIGERIPIYARVQALIDDEYLLIPLYSPWRVAVHRADITGVQLGSNVYDVDLTAIRRLPASDADAPPPTAEPHNH